MPIDINLFNQYPPKIIFKILSYLDDENLREVQLVSKNADAFIHTMLHDTLYDHLLRLKFKQQSVLEQLIYQREYILMCSHAGNSVKRTETHKFVNRPLAKLKNIEKMLSADIKILKKISAKLEKYIDKLRFKKVSAFDLSIFNPVQFEIVIAMLTKWNTDNNAKSIQWVTPKSKLSTSANFGMQGG